MINAPQLTEALSKPPRQPGEAAEGGNRTPLRGEPSGAQPLSADLRLRRGPRHPSAARVCLWLGLLALSAALVGSVVNSVLTGWMAVAGMAAIGLFYLGLSSVAAEQMQSPVSEFADDSAPNSTEQAP